MRPRRVALDFFVHVKTGLTNLLLRSSIEQVLFHPPYHSSSLFSTWADFAAVFSYVRKNLTINSIKLRIHQGVLLLSLSQQFHHELYTENDLRSPNEYFH